MANRAEILTALRANSSQLHALGVRRLALFGSFARDEARHDSDVDLLVELDRRTFDRYMDVKLYLEDLLQRRVDLVPWDRVRAELRASVFADLVHAA